VSAPRFFVEALDRASVTLGEADSRHALRALRLRPGDELLLSDDRGTVARGVLAREERGRAVVDVAETASVARPVPTVGVALVPPSADRLRWAVQKLTELGVDRIELLGSARAVRWAEEAERRRAAERVRAVAREAAMQSRRAFLPDVEAAPSLGEILARPQTVAVLWEGGGSPLAGILPDGADAITLVVGPEGGFTKEEVDAVRRSNAVLASLGAAILRTETAAEAAAVLALARYGRLG
jgi:16S rRNA (uracil1498-N3)-methyltransferase